VPIQRFTASVVAVAALVSGCVLVVPFADPGGPHCGFAGADSPCGKCITAQCIDSVDACCSNDACGGIIVDLESCATKVGASCDRLQNTGDDNGAHRDVSMCVASKCQSECSLPVTNLSHCGLAYLTSVDACSCDVSTAPNGVACTQVGHPRLRCCAPDGWPGPALSCDCTAIICFSSGDGCTCELNAMDGNGRPTTCSTPSGHCCVSRDASCTCGQAECLPTDTPVVSCTLDALKCTGGRHQVESCTVPKP
jgi:hypothetical protein